MTSRHAFTSRLAVAALLAMTTASAAQTAGDDPSVHHPETGQVAPGVDAAPGTAPPPAPGMMGMMTPEMMQMMMRMMSEGGMGMMGGAPGGPMAGGMRGHDMMGGSMRGMDGMSGATGGGMGGLGPDSLYGMPGGAPMEMTPARVRDVLAQLLERHGNPRLAIGEIAEAADGSILAEIVTRDGSLVQRLAFNRYPGLFRQID
jgi:hypothetical protein